MPKSAAVDASVAWREATDERASATWCPRLDEWGGAPGGWLERWERPNPAGLERWLRRIPGRETFVARDPGGAPLVVKRFTRDEPREAWYDRFHGHGARSPARREFENLRALAADGIAVPRPLGWAACATDRRRSVVLMEYVEHDETLRERLTPGLAERAPERSALLELVVGLHRAGWYHRDLYLHQVLWTARGAVLIDVGRARREARPRARWFVKDLAALWSSAPTAIEPDAARAFLVDYLDARGLAPGERTRFERRVARKARRIARHRPRWVDPAEER